MMSMIMMMVMSDDDDDGDDGGGGDDDGDVFACSIAHESLLGLGAEFSVGGRLNPMACLVPQHAEANQIFCSLTLEVSCGDRYGPRKMRRRAH